MLNQLGLSIINTQEYGPESIEASYDAPWMQLLNDVGGWIVGTVIVIGVILVAIAAIIFASSKSSGASRGQEISITTTVVDWRHHGCCWLGRGHYCLGCWPRPRVLTPKLNTTERSDVSDDSICGRR